MTKLFKNEQNDTIRAVEAPDASWVEIDEEEFAAICESKRVFQDAAAIREVKLSTLRQTREAILNRLAGIALAAQLSGDTATTTAYLVVRTALLGITDGLKDLAPELVEPTVLQRYALLREACTPAMVSAFAQVDA